MIANSSPFRITLDRPQSLRTIIAELMGAAFRRQREYPNAMIASVVMQHLVGAELTIALPKVKIKHPGISATDISGIRNGYFLIGNTAIHVSTAPSKALLLKCKENLIQNLHAVIITNTTGINVISELAKSIHLTDQIEILEIEQFIATNVLKQCRFAQSRRFAGIRRLIKTYNRIIDESETDPSLKFLIS
jgi:hypothetical protein